MDDETQNETQNSQPIPPGRISWTDPCVGTQCNLLGAEALCGGLSFWFPPPGESPYVNEDLSNSHHGDDPPLRSTARLRSSSIGTVEWRSQEMLRSPPPGQKESWLGMFRNFRLNFTSQNETTKSKIPFSPPGLARRLKRTHSR
jgi:hypothetical protein